MPSTTNSASKRPTTSTYSIMYDRLKERWSRITLPSMILSTSQDEQQQQQDGQEIAGSRTIRRAKGKQDLRASLQAHQKQKTQTPRTPQHRHEDISQQQDTREQRVTSAVLVADGSLVQLPCGQLVSVNREGLLFSGNEVTSFTPFNSVGIHRPAAFTAATRPSQHDSNLKAHLESDVMKGANETTTNLPSSPESGSNIATSRLYQSKTSISPSFKSERSHRTPHKLAKEECKRAHELLGDVTNNFEVDGRPPKKKRRTYYLTEQPSSNNCKESSASDKSSSPCPQHKKSHKAPRRTQSQPELARLQDNNGENYRARRLFGRRVWSAGDVISALDSGRRVTGSGVATSPPLSPLGHVVATPAYEQYYRLRSPKSRKTELVRAPLVNITEQFVPAFLRQPDPDVQPEQPPPTPGEVWTRVPETKHSNATSDEDEILISFDGASEKKLPADEPGLAAASSFSTSNETDGQANRLTSTGSTKASIIAHVLRSLDKDAKFLQDALQQIEALKTRVQVHARRRDRARLWLDRNTLVDTQIQEQRAKMMTSRYLNEAKAYGEAAERAEAEAREYRINAKRLIENALIEAAMLEFHDTESAEAEGGEANVE